MDATNVPSKIDERNLTDATNRLDNEIESNCNSHDNIEPLARESSNRFARSCDDEKTSNDLDTVICPKTTPNAFSENPQLKIIEGAAKQVENNYESTSCAKNSENTDNSKDEACGASLEKTEKLSVHNSPAPLAFTIDFGDNKEVDTARYQNLFQRYNARHRRNLSTSKIEIKAKKPLPVSSTNCLQKQKAPSTHSEGYFSSEDDTKRKADQLSQKLKELGLKTTAKSQGATRKSDVMSRSYTEKSYKDQSPRSYDETPSSARACRENLSLELNCRAKPSTSNFRNLQHSATMNDLSGVQKSSFDDERSNRVQYSPEKKYTKNIEYIEINHDYESEECLVTTTSIESSEKLSNVNYLSDGGKSAEFVYSGANESKMQISSASFNADTNVEGAEKMNLDIFNVSNADAASDGTVSEAGTYTIHKDYTDEEKARMDIDKAFSVGVLTEHESEETYVHHFKMTSSRDTNTWISEWATQVAEHNSLPPSVGGSTGRTPPMSPSKIPSPIYSRSQRLSRNRYEQSDSSLDMDTHLHIKERLGTVPNQHILIDSGGESDEDTSNSYVTPPHSSQRTPTHGASLVRRGSLSDSLFKRASINDGRRSARKFVDNKINKMDEAVTKSPSHALANLHLERSSSLDRKEYTSDTAESNSSRKSSLRNYAEENLRHTNSPILNRLRPSTPKLTNSPILAHKELATKVINSPLLDKTKHLIKTSTQTHNVGYYTCSESSPYMLRKSNSTSNYHEDTSIHSKKELTTNISSVYQNSPIFQRNVNIQRSTSNASIRNAKLKSVLARRSSFNNNDIDRLVSSKGKFNTAGSDSSSEAGEQQTAPSVPPISSGIKLNRAFSIRRGRLSCESDTTPNTTPEERRRKAQTEIKSAPCSARQPNHHRGRTSSVGAKSKEVFKKPEPPKPRAPSISRTDTGRFSMRAPKSAHATPTARPNQKTSKDHKKSTRSNSTLTSKEVEFQNWKRRKSYDPMKAAAEGKKKIDGPKKHHSIENGTASRDNSVLRSASFHGTRGTLSLADDWSDNEIEFAQKAVQAPPPCSPQLGSDSDLETCSYLQTTHNVMSAMSARINVYNPVDSGGESDEDTSHSFRQGNNKMTRETSDTESSDEPQAATQSPITNTKYNRAFSLRRGRLEPQETKTSSAPTTKPKTQPATVTTKGKIEAVPSISRTDSGRFSIRMPKTTTNASKTKSKEPKKPVTPNTREVEMQNWKRRKSYDPMKAAMEGKRKAGLAKRSPNTNSSSSHVSRSQSFHGPATLGISEWSDEDVSASADEAPIY